MSVQTLFALPEPYYWDDAWESQDIEAALEDDGIAALFHEAFVADGPAYKKAIAAAKLVGKGIIRSRRDDEIDTKQSQASKSAARKKASKVTLGAFGEDSPRRLGQGAPPRVLKSRPCIITASEVEPEDVRWFWPGRLALGTINLVMGYPGQGKSTFLSILAAWASTGRRWPDQPPGEHVPDPGHVLIVQQEESRAQSIRPRLDKLGADLERVHFLPGVYRGDNPLEPFAIARDMEALETAIKSVGDTRLLIIDPIEGFMGDCSTYSAPEVRKALGPLCAIAERHDVCMVGIHHMSKSSDRRIRDRGQGSAAFVQTARCVWYISEDPLDKRRRLFTLVKLNFPDVPRWGIGYGLENGYPRWDSDKIEMEADEVDALDAKVRAQNAITMRGPQPTEAVRAEEFLRQFLADGKAVAQEAVIRAAGDKGIAESSIRRAIKRALRKVDGEPPEILKSKPEGKTRYFLEKYRPSPSDEAARSAWVRAFLGLDEPPGPLALTFVKTSAKPSAKPRVWRSGERQVS